VRCPCIREIALKNVTPGMDKRPYSGHCQLVHPAARISPSKLQMVRGFEVVEPGSKGRSSTVPARCLGASSLPSMNNLVGDHLSGDVGQFTPLPRFHYVKLKRISLAHQGHRADAALRRA
jgi:hypothetical protein